MDKEQIIIDGVNITGCTWCDFEPNAEPYCHINDGEDLTCEDNPNCYFKQLARKTAECEELKIYIESNEQQVKEVETLVMDNDRLINELDQLKAENERLKESLKVWQYSDVQHIFEIKKYEQTLTEIKEIAEKAKKDICNNCGWRNTDSCDPEGYTCLEFIKILQKISEVEK